MTNPTFKFSGRSQYNHVEVKEMAKSLYGTHLQGIMVVVVIKTNIQSKMIDTNYLNSLQLQLVEGTEN